MNMSSESFHSPPQRSEPFYNGYRGEPRPPLHQKRVSLTNIYIKFVPEDFRDDDLYKLCSEFGAITRSRALSDLETGKCTGIGFVEFREPEDAQKCLNSGIFQREGMAACMAEERPAFRSRGGRNGSWNGHGINSESPTLFFGHVPPNWTVEFLRSLVTESAKGEVRACRISAKGYKTGNCAFVKMENDEQCDRVIDELNGKKFDENFPALFIQYAKYPSHERESFNNGRNFGNAKSSMQRQMFQHERLNNSFKSFPVHPNAVPFRPHIINHEAPPMMFPGMPEHAPAFQMWFPSQPYVGGHCAYFPYWLPNNEMPQQLAPVDAQLNGHAFPGMNMVPVPYSQFLHYPHPMPPMGGPQMRPHYPQGIVNGSAVPMTLAPTEPNFQTLPAASQN